MDYQKAMDVICNTILDVIDKKNKELNYDKTFPSAILSIGEKGKYKIQKDAGIYDVSNATGVPLSIGQKVWVKIPCGNLEKMHICGIR